MRHKKFVLDTNIWISYFINKKESQLAEYISAKKVIFFACAELMIEIKRVLAYPHLLSFGIDIPAAITLIKDITVTVDLQYPIKNYIPEDRDDDYIIALALQTGSGFVTSGDQHILSAKTQLENKYKKLQILTLTEFEKMMK
jgi:putative PIN family toxin of toxin-antitoxin system